METEWSGPYGRRELAHQFGAGTMDCLNLHWDCVGCRRPVDDRNVYTVGSVDYRSLDELVAHSRQALGVADMTECPCPTCGRQATLRAADYHTYQADPDRDFVLRWTPGATAPTWWFWDDDGYRATTTMVDERYPDDIFEDETAVRRAETRLGVEGIEAALPDIEAAAAQCDGWWELLGFVRPLAEFGRVALAREIAVAYLQSHVDNPEEGTEIQQARYEEARALLASVEGGGDGGDGDGDE